MGSSSFRTERRGDAWSSARRWCLVLVLISVACAQALGFMHGIAHAFHADGQHTEHVGDAVRHASHPEAAAEAQDWLEVLFAAHEEAGDCRLFDALGQQGPMLSSPVSLPMLMPSMSFQRLLAGAFVARRAALFEARGPPASH